MAMVMVMDTVTVMVMVNRNSDLFNNNKKESNNFKKKESEVFMKRKEYESPQTLIVEVELENGFMAASVFQPEDKHDKGVTIDGHEFGNQIDLSGDGWDDETTGSSF